MSKNTFRSEWDIFNGLIHAVDCLDVNTVDLSEWGTTEKESYGFHVKEVTMDNQTGDRSEITDDDTSVTDCIFDETDNSIISSNDTERSLDDFCQTLITVDMSEGGLSTKLAQMNPRQSNRSTSRRDPNQSSCSHRVKSKEKESSSGVFKSNNVLNSQFSSNEKKYYERKHKFSHGKAKKELPSTSSMIRFAAFLEGKRPCLTSALEKSREQILHAYKLQVQHNKENKQFI